MTAPEAVAALFTNQQIWSERSQPFIQEQAIRMFGPNAAIVDAHLVQHGSALGRIAVPVVLVLTKVEGSWKIAAWRTQDCGLLPVGR